jgi:hypothetical protein
MEREPYDPLADCEQRLQYYEQQVAFARDSVAFWQKYLEQHRDLLQAYQRKRATVLLQIAQANSLNAGLTQQKAA